MIHAYTHTLYTFYIFHVYKKRINMKWNFNDVCNT